jgi:hypothetical protein
VQDLKPSIADENIFSIKGELSLSLKVHRLVIKSKIEFLRQTEYRVISACLLINSSGS